ncbi:MAG: alpha-glucosidase, partial [Micromonosporaceae bacterium]|nr:alpha-glucosidase [Micromonosporaceae bacterium]
VGVLSLSVRRIGVTVLSPAAVGIVNTTADLTRGLVFVSRSDRPVTESYTMVTGKQRSRQNAFTETTLSYTGTGGTRMDLVVRVANDGVAYRYNLPATGTIRVTREASAWSVPASAPAWLQAYQIEDQGRWFQSTAGGAPAGRYAYPMLFNVNNTFVLLAESGVDGRYDGSTLNHAAGSGTYTTMLMDAQITSTGPLSTVWRTAVVGDLSTVTQSRLVDDVAPPSKIADTSWIHPGTVAWSWLTEHASPSDPARQRAYVDFAQQNKWPYILIDEGWDASWVPSVVSYAAARGVGVLLWFNSSQLRTAAQQQAMLPLVKSWGVAGIKVDFIFDDNQPTMQWYDGILARTAQLKLMINFHGADMPRGMQRTWPHVMTAEAVFGAEQQNNMAAFNTILPFTRNAVSSMDFTPVVFSIKRNTTDAHEVATFVVFESGWTHAADNPESYRAHPEALRTLNMLPTVWDETRLLAGTPGREAYVARRNGGRWYIGGISGISAKTFTTPLNFLGSGQWMVDTLRNGTTPTSLLHETRVVDNTATLSVPMLTNGGFVSVVCPFTAGMTGCA